MRIRRLLCLSSRYPGSRTRVPTNVASSLQEAQCAKYLETVLPLLESAADEARTSAVVAAFLTTGDGPKLQALLEEYDAEQDNYVEHFVRRHSPFSLFLIKKHRAWLWCYVVSD